MIDSDAPRGGVLDPKLRNKRLDTYYELIYLTDVTQRDIRLN